MKVKRLLTDMETNLGLAGKVSEKEAVVGKDGIHMVSQKRLRRFNNVKK